MAGPGAERLFGEQVAPVAAPSLLKAQRIRNVEDLLRLPLIELEDPNGSALWLSWKVWCEAMGVARPRTSHGLTFSHYDQVVQAAVAGQGVALGRFPLLDPFVAQRRLALPLKGRQYSTLARRAYCWSRRRGRLNAPRYKPSLLGCEKWLPISNRLPQRNAEAIGALPAPHSPGVDVHEPLAG